jgi:hypothetical protein
METDLPDYMRRLWIAEAPLGQWSSGPVVIYDIPGEADSCEQYRAMGWTVVGPYVLAGSNA